MSIGSVGSAMNVASVVGARVRSMVVATGDKLELKYIDASQARTPASGDETGEAAQVGSAASDTDSPAVAEAEARHRLILNAQERQQLERVVAQATDGPAMAKNGLFLSKMDLPMNTAQLQALYEAQRGNALNVGLTSHAESSDAPEISAPVAGVMRGEDDSAAELSALLLEALSMLDAGTSMSDPSAPVPDTRTTPDAVALMPQTGGDCGADGGTRRELARSPLNTQDDGSIAYRYGTLPVLVADQLVELDLVSSRQRRPERGGDESRRLIMTLNTQSLGRVQVEVRALGERLTITFAGQSVHATQELARYADEIRELGSRFGWSVEEIRR